jgi:uncharacterized phiE125 gp8 family phage protein
MLKLKTAPAKLPISVQEAKAFLNEDSPDFDLVIELILRSTVSQLDGHRGLLGRCMIRQTWEYYPAAFPAGLLKIPLGDLLSVATIEYKDPTTGNFTTWSSSNYSVDTQAGVVKANSSWPTPKTDVLQPIRVTFDAGFGDNPADVPAAIREAMLMLLVDRFENRGAVSHETIPTSVPFGVDFKLAPFRRIHF